MRHSIPIHFALLGSVVTLLLGIVIGSQFVQPPATNTFNYDRQKENRTVQTSWRGSPLALASKESQNVTGFETREPSRKRRSIFAKDPSSALADAFEQKKVRSD